MPTSAFKDTCFPQTYLLPFCLPWLFTQTKKSTKNHEKRTRNARQLSKAPCLHAFSTRSISSPLNSNLKPTQETYVSCESRTKAVSVKTFKGTVPSAPSSKGVTAENMQRWSLHWRKTAVKTCQVIERITECFALEGTFKELFQNCPCHVQTSSLDYVAWKPTIQKSVTQTELQASATVVHF